MCGIAGILRVHAPAGQGGLALPPPEAAIPEAWLDILDESIKHRGPDGQGRFRDRAVRADGTVVDVALVHRRLSIIDHAGGAQPMVSARGRNEGEGLVAVVFNGCIYNHRELRRELQGAGHRFETDHSDTEVLVHGWREWGVELCQRLNGMFSLLIWDAVKGELFAARDQFGEKPLYFVSEGRSTNLVFALASTVPGLAVLPLEPGEWKRPRDRVSKIGLRHWIRFGFSLVTPDETIGEIMPGRGGEAPSRATSTFMPHFGWWKRWSRPVGPRSHQPPIERIDDLLSRSVELRLQADVPVGCFLSGGVDSSLIAAHARRLRPDVRAFTVRMPDSELDESEKAKRLAGHIGIEHVVLDCQARPAEDLEHLIRQLGLPFGDSSLLPTYWVCRAAARQVKVALSGDGGDELFAGYKRYRAAHLLGMVGIARHLGWLAMPLCRPDGGANSKANVRARFLQAAVGDRYLDLVSTFAKQDLARLGAGRESLAARAWTGMFDIVGDVMSPFHEWLTRFRVGMAIGTDLGMYLPGDILRKTDTASMAVPLEVRAPFLDGELAGAAMEARVAHLVRGGDKGLLRAVARKYLPAEIVDRPKQGFAIPIGEWFRSDYGGMKQLLMDHLNSSEPWGPASLGIELNMKFVRRMLDEHMGTGMSGRITRDHSQRLYMLLVLSIWAKWMGRL